MGWGGMGGKVQPSSNHSHSKMGRAGKGWVWLTRENGSHPRDDPGGKDRNHTYDVQHSRLTRGLRLETIPQTILIALAEFKVHGCGPGGFSKVRMAVA